MKKKRFGFKRTKQFFRKPAKKPERLSGEFINGYRMEEDGLYYWVEPTETKQGLWLKPIGKGLTKEAALSVEKK